LTGTFIKKKFKHHSEWQNSSAHRLLSKKVLCYACLHLPWFPR
jgi:hypothetical protein